MPNEDVCVSTGVSRIPALKHWGAYLIKAIVLVGLLYVLGQYAGTLPTWGIALVWAALSAVSAIGLTYRRVVRKTLKQYAYEKEGHLARFNNGRVLCLIVSFVASAVCMAALLLEIPTWQMAEWILAGAAIPLFMIVSWGVQRFVRGECAPAFRASKVAVWSGGIVAFVLVAVYAVVVLVQPAETFASASEAFLAAPQPFAASPSTLASEAGMLTALVDGFAIYGASRAAEVSTAGYLALKIVLVVSAFGGIAGLLSLCSLEWAELKRVFLPLEVVTHPDAPRTLVKRNVVMAVLLPVVLVALYGGADYAAARAVQTEEYSAAQHFVRDQVDLAVYVLDGTYYDHQAVQSLLQEARLEAAALAEDAQATLVPLINASYDARVANVDSYLDWYYSLPADYERLLRLITGSVEEFVEGQFVEHIEAGIDDSAFEEQLQGYWDRARALEDELTERLSAYEIPDVPAWLPVIKEDLATDFLEKTLEPSEQLVSAGQRLLVSAGAGALAGKGVSVAARHLVAKASEKSFIKMVVSEITSRLGSRAVGSAVGGAVGTVGGPLGVAAGIVAGGAVGVGVDYGLLKWDELWNRDSYKDEVVQTIEEARTEMLATVQGA